MQELSGGGPAPNAEPQHRIEAGPGGYDQQGPPADDVKPWQRGPTGAAAPWQSRGRGGDDYNSRDAAPSGGAAPWARDRSDRGSRGYDNRGGDSYGHQDNGYGAPPPPPGGAAPWQQPPPPAAPAYGAYGGYAAPGYGAGYPPQSSMGAPPGLGGAPGALGAPPGAPPGLSGAGLSALLQQFTGAPPPPPPSGAAPPPPPPGSAPPPPPPSDQPPPPPPSH
jgi:splicing factor 1